MTDAIHIKYIKDTLNEFICMGIRIPMTSVGLMNLFKDHGSKAQIIQWFKENRITWTKPMGVQQSDSEYQANMNTSIIHYLENC